ncbi:MAG: PEP/pyruvate-binding domain-containing protein [Syntrophotaleaceae bacterium]
MVRSDLACAGVMFTIATESGFPHVVLINAAWGLGENVVRGAVNPDEFYVFADPSSRVFRPILSTAGQQGAPDCLCQRQASRAPERFRCPRRPGNVSV